MIPISPRIQNMVIQAGVGTHPQLRAHRFMVGKYRTGGPRVFEDKGQGPNDNPDHDYHQLHPTTDAQRQSPPWTKP